MLEKNRLGNASKVYFIAPILNLGYPIVGIVSDGRRSIRLAFGTFNGK
jgi:hypothetical protein